MQRSRGGASGPDTGEIVGQWRLVRPLGAGGMATVWLAEPASGVGDPVAVKVLHQARITTEETRRMRREYLTLARLHHAHVVKVLDAGQFEGIPWLALQYVSGSDLGAVLEGWLKEAPADRWAFAERMVRELADALAHVHSLGVVHRDLKPGNVIVGDDGKFWLTDFGVVKDVESFHTNLTVAGRLVGTVAFMAPEQITGDPVDSRADLYGLGALLYAVLTGRRPVVADTIAGYLARQLAEMPKSPLELDPLVPPRLDRICMRLLQKDPKQRFATAQEVLAALDAEEGTTVLPIQGQAEVLARLARRLDDVAAGVGGAVAVLGPPGSGRSRMLLEARTLAQARGLSVGPQGQVVVVESLASLSRAEAEAVRARMATALSGQPGLLVMAGAAPLSAAAHDLADGVPIEELVLEPLDRDGVRALLRDQGVGGGLGAALARRLYTDLGGRPGPIVAQLDALLAEGWLARSSDGSVRAVRTVDQLRIDPLPIPPAERAAAQAAATALKPGERALLEAAAVLAMPTSAAVLIATAAAGDAPAVDALVRSGLLVARAEGLQELVELASPRLGQALREGLDDGRRQGLHAAAAAALRERYGRAGGAIAELVAMHLERAGMAREARPLLVGAAQAALRRGEVGAARTLAERAQRLESAGAIADAAEEARVARSTRVVLGDALRAAGHLRKSLDTWASALSIPGSAPAETSRLFVNVAMVGVELGEAAAAEPDLVRGLAGLPQGDGVWAEATHVAAELAFGRGDRAAATSRWHGLAAYASESRNALAGILADYGALVIHAGSVGQALAGWSALFDRALRLSRPGPLSLVAAQLGRVGLEIGDIARVGSLADELAERAERHEWSEVGALAASLRAGALSASGDSTGALSSAREALTALGVEEGRNGLVASFAIRAWADVEEATLAAAWLERDTLRPAAPFDAEALRFSLLARCLCRSRPAAALQAARSALARPTLSAPGGAWVRLDVAVALQTVGVSKEADSAVEGLEQALRAGGATGLLKRLEQFRRMRR